MRGYGEDPNYEAPAIVWQVMQEKTEWGARVLKMKNEEKRRAMKREEDTEIDKRKRYTPHLMAGKHNLWNTRKL